jgi:hypothetical protein
MYRRTNSSLASVPTIKATGERGEGIEESEVTLKRQRVEREENGKMSRIFALRNTLCLP